jgi:hypothetical protein
VRFVIVSGIVDEGEKVCGVGWVVEEVDDAIDRGRWDVC